MSKATPFEYNSITDIYDKNKNLDFIKSFISINKTDHETALKIIKIANGMNNFRANTGYEAYLKGQDPNYYFKIYGEEFIKKIFKKYMELVNEAQNVAQYVEENTKEDSELNKIEISNTVEEVLLKKGKDLLSSYADQIKEQEGKDIGNIVKDLENKLELVKASLITFGATVKELVKNREFNIEEFKGVSLDKITSDQIEDKEKRSMEAIAFENTRQYPEKLAEYWYDTATNALENKNNNEDFIIVKHDKDIVGFMRVQNNPDGSYYGASFNVNPFVKGSRVGTELLKKVIDDYTQKGDFHADVYENNPMLKNYMDQFGFEVIGKEENYHNTGATIVKIVKRKKEDAMPVAV